MNKKIIFYITIIVLGSINLLFSYSLWWNPYELLFNSPKFSNIFYETRDLLSTLCGTLNVSILWLSLAWFIYKFIKMGKLNFLAPVVTVITFIIYSNLDNLAPNVYNEYTEEGHQILEQTWYNRNDTVFKKWRSLDSLKNVPNHRERVWIFQDPEKE